MSNTQVGAVYQQIISDVVESSRVDFEEGGVDDSVLEELRQGWQRKLSQLNVATFPWDPKPEPNPIMHPPTVPSNGSAYPNMSTPPQIPIPQLPGAPRIKSEPGLEPPFSGINIPNGTIAQQRAAQHLSAYGPRAQASIEAIGGRAQHQPPMNQQAMQQQHMQQQHMMQPPQQGQGTPQPQQQPRPPMTQQQQQAQYNRAMAAQAAEGVKRHSVGNAQQAQTDGPGDEMDDSAVLARQFNAQGEEVAMGRVEIDDLIRTKIQSMGQSMEGGGLMLPLAEASSSSSRRARKTTKSKSKSPKDGVQGDSIGGQNDGNDEDELNGIKEENSDEDAINSDLDDPEDGLGAEEDDDEAMGHIMLCMYDKVQRVKNKWKCVMKDGVLTVNEREYVFHKATGEYEW